MTTCPNRTQRRVTGIPRIKPRPGFSLLELLVVFLIIGVVIALLLPATRSARPAAQRTQCKNNLKQIALALYNYESAYQSFPPAYTVDAAGRPLHSWRTLILPYRDQKPLYDSIDLSKPWDDPVNAAAVTLCPYAFCCPSADVPPNCTTYLGLVSSTGCFHPTEGRRFSEITRDHSQTLMVIEVSSDEAVPWMAPRDTDGRSVLTFDGKTGFSHEGGTNAAFVDGSVRFLSSNISIADRRAMLTIAEDEHTAAAGSSTVGP